MKRTLTIVIFFGFANTFCLAQGLEIPAGKFLSSLNAKLRQKAQYPFEDDERFNWHYIPRSRKGISFHDMDAMQRQAAMELLKASLSEQGYKKASDIIELEDILRQVEGLGANDDYRDRLNYYFTFFGTPSKDKPWGWRLEGHHVSLNFASSRGTMESSTPSFFGTNPAIVPNGKDKGKQILKLETTLGFALANSLNTDQKKTAIISEHAPSDILSRNDRKAKELEPKGLAYTSMDEAQKKVFMQLLDAYVKNYVFGFSSKLMEKIKKAGIENLHFAWAGSLKPGVGHYYRIQGPMLLIEYDNTQNNANHVHTVVRDLTNDFAEDILKEHYRKDHAR